MAARSPARSSTGPEVERSGRAHLVGDDVGERRLAQPRRPEQQHVVERLAALARRLHEDAQVVDDLPLADVVVELPRPQRLLELQLVGVGRARDQARGVGHGDDCSRAPSV